MLDVMNQSNDLKNLSIILFALILPFMTYSVMAKNLGVQGAIYQITEPDMLTGIQTKLEVMQKSGELERENQAVLNRTVQHILRPRPVSGVSDLPKGETPQIRTFNPSIILSKTIKDTHGDVIAVKGTRVNPLDYMDFDELLVFINGDNSSQVKWMSELINKAKSQNQKLKIILVNGNIKTTSTALKTQVYFDQYGKLCQHFKITHTPTLVFEPQHQKGSEKKLVVKEVQID